MPSSPPVRSRGTGRVGAVGGAALFEHAGKTTMSEESRLGSARWVDRALEGCIGVTGGNRGTAGGGDPGCGFGPTRTTLTADRIGVRPTQLHGAVSRIGRRRNPTSKLRTSMFHVGLRCANPTYGSVESRCGEQLRFTLTPCFCIDSRLNRSPMRRIVGFMTATGCAGPDTRPLSAMRSRGHESASC